jgi:hypothetical protein
MTSHKEHKGYKAHKGSLSTLRGVCVSPLMFFVAFVSFVLIFVASSSALAAERYAVVVTGASGGDNYATKYDSWRTTFVNLLRGFNYPDDHIVVLAEREEGTVRKATRENVRAALTDLRRRTEKDDVVVLLLIGHGTSGDSEEAKFNLVGPDLSADEWAALVRPIPGRVVFIDTTAGSFPFLKKIAGKNRVVITATDNAAQQFETVFPEFLVKAFGEEGADQDKNGKVSVWEAFQYASAHVRDWFTDRGQLATERPLLDDTGTGIGREFDTPGPDGTVALVTYLAPEAPPANTGNSELDALLRHRAELQMRLEQLKARKPNMTSDDYDAELERILLELARIDRQVRNKS